MAHRKATNRRKAKTILRLPDLEQSKTAVLNSLADASSRETEKSSTVHDQHCLAAVRRLGHEASDTGLLSPELAAGIRRVKGEKLLGVRIGNWFTVDQSSTLLAEPLAGKVV